MLVIDGREYPDEPQNQEPTEPKVELTDEEIMEAVRAYEAMKRQGRTQQVKAAQKPELSDEEAEEVVETIRKNPPQMRTGNDSYGEYKFVDDDEEYPTGIKAFTQSAARLLLKANWKIVALGIVALILIVAGVNSWRGGKSEVQSQPTQQSVQPVQPVQPVQTAAPVAGCETHQAAIVEIGPDYIKFGDGYQVWVGAEAVKMYVLNQQGSYTICQ